MPEPRLDLLREPIFSTDQGGPPLARTLPGVLAALARQEPIEFLALRPHQQHPWHAFLCQLAALVCDHHPGEPWPTDEATWHAGILALTAGQLEPWCLIVEDLSKPAFLQPPVPENKLAGFSTIETPDALDLLVTSKNHDVKLAQIAHASPELWTYALLTLQTFQGFSGRDNYGIARMNGGYGNRPCVTTTTGLSWAERWQRDTRLLLSTRDQTTASFGFSDRGQALLWVEPWAGNTSFPLAQCHPFFIEICRRIRFTSRRGQIAAWGASSRAPRLDGKARLGDLGDLWTPIKIEDPPASLSTGEAGFSYKLTQRLIFGEGYKPSLAQELPRGEARLFFLGQALSRGKGKTDGYHERIVPIPARARPALGQKARRDQLGLLARSRVERTEEARLKLLKPAICVLLQGAPEKLDFKDNRPQRWLDQLDQEVDRCFFDQLWNDMDLPPEEANVRWDQLLVTACWRLLQRATGEAPVPLARRYRAVASAENVFRGSARQKFPGASLSSLDRSHHDRTSEAT